ncbi:MAG: hypothetical protein JXQ75_23025 [Phycisphaerae bacterium]|nr:hypothetical protein [Phycisphaerae bacterium]
MRSAFHLILVFGLLPGGPLHAEDPSNPNAAAELRRTVTEHLATGRIDAALREAQRTLEDHQDDPAVRAEFVSLHLALARQMLTEEEFATADRALQAVVKVAPNHPEACRLATGIQTARREVPSRVQQAERWLILERFEPAFNTFRQARALIPERENEWTAVFVKAATGAGDDHYLCKNFHEAFYYYDAATRLSTGQPSRIPPSLVSRWLQSMVHALGEDVDRVSYPPDYWRMTLQRADAARPGGPEGEMMRTVLRGLAYENAGLLDRAASQYAAVLGGPVGALDPDVVRRGRQAALKRIRRWYDPRLSDRRSGLWANSEPGDWRVVETARFRIHHHNGQAAQRVADALPFHFDRVAAFLGRRGDQVPWERACDVYLHRDAEAFRKATGQQHDVQAISVIRHRGHHLEGHEIHANQADPMLLATHLPHELTHLMQAAIVGYRPTVAAINEGIALHVEPRCRHVQFARLFGQSSKPRGVSALLAVGEVHPAEPAFYAEAHRLVSILLERSDGGTVLARSLAPLDRGRLAELFGFESSRALESAYLGH